MPTSSQIAAVHDVVHQYEEGLITEQECLNNILLTIAPGELVTTPGEENNQNNPS